MRPFMDIQCGLLCEPFQTHITLKWSFTGVDPHVNIQIRFTAKSCVTLCALERFVHTPITWKLYNQK